MIKIVSKTAGYEKYLSPDTRDCVQGQRVIIHEDRYSSTIAELYKRERRQLYEPTLFCEPGGMEY